MAELVAAEERARGARDECTRAKRLLERRQTSGRATWAHLGRANLEVFADTLLEARQRTILDILAVTSDSRGSGKLDRFGKQLPQQIVEVGIAEQNLVGISAGLAAVGQDAIRRLAGLLSHGPVAGADQERCLLFRRAGRRWSASAPASATARWEAPIIRCTTCRAASDI